MYRVGNSKSLLILNDAGDSASYDYDGIYIEEQYLDTLCEAGYNDKLQGGTKKEQHNQLGFWDNNQYFRWTYVYYAYGQAHIFHIDLNKAGYEDLGSAWAGGVQADNKIYMYNFYNYFSNYGVDSILGRGFEAAVKPTTNNIVDISSFVSVQNGNLVVDTTALQSVYGISGDVEYMPIVQRDDYYLDCSVINMCVTEYVRPIYTIANETMNRVVPTTRFNLFIVIVMNINND